MAWQKCPVCEGAGCTGIGFPYGATCSVCKGQKIISDITGTPPYEIVTTTGTDYNTFGIWKIDKKSEEE